MIELAAAIAAVALGAFVQGVAGFGFALVAAPLVALAEPGAVPVAVIVASSVLNLFVFTRDRSGLDVAAVGWALAGSLPGAVAGAVLVDAVPEGSRDWLVATIVLALVGLSLVRPDVSPVPRVLAGAGVLSGFCGTVSSVGGPPVALALQHTSGLRLRGTLAGYFFLGGIQSLAFLALVGELHADDVSLGVVLAPAVIVGFAASRRLALRFEGRTVRPGVLAISAASSLVLVARQLV